MKRFFFFILTNLAVLVLINIVLIVLSKVFGINLSGYGYDYTAILSFAAVVGFSGAIVSLFMSKWSAKKAYRITPITQDRLHGLSSKEKLVYDTVLDIANKHGIKTPEVWVYQGKDPNAFATGATKNSSLVAVSTGLLDLMNEREIEWVVAHEMAHILNGDMVTMTLMQWVVNTFVVFISRVLANIIDSYFNKWENNGPSFIYYIASIVLDIVFGLLASVIVMWFSRYREFRADEGSARYVGKEKMIAALEALRKMKDLAPANDSKLATMKISTKRPGGIRALFSSHPPLSSRIRNLEDYRI